MAEEESRTLDLVELTREAIEAAGRRDFDVAMSWYTESSVCDMSPIGAGAYHVRMAAIVTPAPAMTPARKRRIRRIERPELAPVSRQSAPDSAGFDRIAPELFRSSKPKPPSMTG